MRHLPPTAVERFPLGPDFEEAPADASYDARARDGSCIVELKDSLMSARDLHAGLVLLATALHREAPGVQGVLVARRAGVSADRIRSEWRQLLDVLRPTISSRLGLVVFGEPVLRLPESPKMQAFVDRLHLPPVAAGLPVAHPEQRIPSRKFFEIWKVLLAHWLLRRGPLPVGELMRQSNCAHPTVLRALQRLDERGEIRRTSRRGVELFDFPRETFGEALALSEGLRDPIRFIDRSGRSADPAALLRRLERIAPPAIAIGGVIAARFYDPKLDLEGTPRLDVTVHAPEVPMALDFVNQLDPALGRTGVGGDVDPALHRSPGGADVVLVVHQLRRAESLFGHAKQGLPAADPVETLFDLHELRLNDQAEAMVRRLRAKEMR